MPAISKGWAWLKKNAVYILGGLLAIVGVIFAIKYERRKVAKLKGQVVMSRTNGKLEVLKARREELLAEDKILQGKEKEIDAMIVDKEKELLEIKKKVEDMDDDEIVAEFNRLYSSP